MTLTLVRPCAHCQRPNDTQKPSPYCRACWSAHHTARRAGRRMTGRCRECGAPTAPTSLLRCEGCLARRRVDKRPRPVSGVWTYLDCGHSAAAYPVGHDATDCTERTNRFLDAWLADSACSAG